MQFFILNQGELKKKLYISKVSIKSSAMIKAQSVLVGNINKKRVTVNAKCLLICSEGLKSPSGGVMIDWKRRI